MSYTLEKPTEADYQEIVDVWEASVRATHDFLPESDILYFKPLILNDYLKLVDLSYIRIDGRIAGFSGIAEGKIEMLFIDPQWRGKGIGRFLTEHAISKQAATTVDVNEQNPQAVGFYKRLGFKVYERSPLDGLGKPYPILHMTLHPQDIHIHLAEISNIPEILVMMADFYSIDDYPFQKDSAEKNLQKFIGNDALGRLSLVYQGEVLTGYITLTFGFSFEYGGRDAFIDEFYLKSHFRDQGIGSAVMDLIADQAKALGVNAIHLEVENQNDAGQALYRRKGFRGNDRALLTRKL